MKKCMTWLLGSLLLTLALPVVAAAQDCDASIIIDYLSTDRDGLETFSLGVYLANTCDVGGIQFDIIPIRPMLSGRLMPTRPAVGFPIGKSQESGILTIID